MSERITITNLRRLVEHLNDRAGFKGQKVWNRVGNQNVATIGMFVLNASYGGYGLAQIMNEGGGERTIISLGTARETYHAMHTLIRGMEMGKDGVLKNPARRRTRKNPDGVRIVHNRLLGGWYIVRGPHQTPISGRFPSKEAAQQSLIDAKNRRDGFVQKNPLTPSVTKRRDGSLEVSDIVGGYLVRRIYYGHSKREAVRLFREEMTKPKKNPLTKSEKKKLRRVISRVQPGSLRRKLKRKIRKAGVRLNPMKSSPQIFIKRAGRTIAILRDSPINRTLAKRIVLTLRRSGSKGGGEVKAFVGS